MGIFMAVGVWMIVSQIWVAEMDRSFRDGEDKASRRCYLAHGYRLQREDSLVKNQRRNMTKAKLRADLPNIPRP